MARLFFALQPSSDDLDQLARAMPENPGAGRVIPRENLHVTLAFLGELGAEKAAAAREAADGVQAPPVTLCFTALAYWPGPRTRVLVPEEVTAAAQTLRGELARRLRERNVPFDARIWRPHLTVARKARPAEEVRLEPLLLGFKEFVLVHSRTEPAGARYESIGRWPLQEHRSV